MTDAPLPETYVADFHDLDAVKRMEYRHVSHFGLVSTVSFGASGLGGMFTAGQGTGLKGAEVRAAPAQKSPAARGTWSVEPGTQATRLIKS